MSGKTKEEKKQIIADLKEYLQQNTHVEKVYFDVHGNWFLHKNRTVTSEKTVEEIMEMKDDEETPKKTEPLVKPKKADVKK